MDNSNAELLGDYLPHALLADALGMSLKTLENMNRAGDGPPRVRLGRFTYYHKESVRDWLRTREQGRGE